MAKIASLEVVIADVSTIRPHVLAMATMQTQAVVLLFLRRDDDIVGVGEATTIGGLTYGEERGGASTQALSPCSLGG